MRCYWCGRKINSYSASDGLFGGLTVSLKTRTLPLHHSQQELETTATTVTIKPTETSKGYSIFTYYLTPNYDFIHDLLYFGDDVEVLEPLILSKCIKNIILELNNKYE